MPLRGIMQKLYAYVDESGQETGGAIFLVSVVIIGKERDDLADWLIDVEKTTKKGVRKWMKADDTKRTAYMQAVLSTSLFRGKLLYGVHRNTREYVQATVETTAAAIVATAQDEYKATVVVDGLRGVERQRFAVALRQRGIRTEKVRGAEEQRDPLVRLADALCGFLRDADGGREAYQKLRDRAIAEGIITQVGQ
jgi:hypothetical protein